MRTSAFGRSAILLASLAALLLSACEPLPPGGPGPGAGPRISATLLTAGEGVRVNGFPATAGQTIRPGDSLTTGPTAAARVEFSEGTFVELVDTTDPVRFDWTAEELTIRVDDATGRVEKSDEGFFLVRVLGRLAEIFSVSRFVFEERYPRYFRADLFSGRIEMVRPRPGTTIGPGQYVEAYPDGRVDVGQTSQRRARELRARFERWNFTRAELRPVPRLTDRGLAEAVAEIERAGFRLGRISGPNRRDGEVIAQRPSAGERVAPGTRIDLSVRVAEVGVRVPNLRGLSYAEARREIGDSRLRLGSVSGARGGDRYVTSQDPPPGREVRPGSTVDLVLRSREVQTVPVPDVRQSLLRQAIAELERAGLKPGRISGSTQGDAVYVVDQSPRPGTRAQRGASVDLVVRGVIQ